MHCSACCQCRHSYRHFYNMPLDLVAYDHSLMSYYIQNLLAVINRNRQNNGAQVPHQPPGKTNETPTESDSDEENTISSSSEEESDDDELSELSSYESSAESDEEDLDAEGEFEHVDSAVEEFEYVQLDRFGNMPENSHGRSRVPNVYGDEKAEKELKSYLYGDKADVISGLETAITLGFSRQCDLYQPHMWPVLPIRLN